MRWWHRAVPAEGGSPALSVVQHLKGLCMLEALAVTSKPEFIPIPLLRAKPRSALGSNL